ncbi:MAG: Rrf2 family transcriptional regulator [Candidatus Gracilibacteria bacterium]|jgi:Rrf2 family protein
MNRAKQKSGSLNLTKKADYGLFLLTVLAKRGLSIKSIQAIADENNLSFSFLQKIARILQKGGLISAERGKFGGYRLIKKPEEITLKEILETLEGPVAIAPCFMRTPGNLCCAHKQFCAIKNGLKKINDEIKNTLLSKTLKHFI